MNFEWPNKTLLLRGGQRGMVKLYRPTDLLRLPMANDENLTNSTGNWNPSNPTLSGMSQPDFPRVQPNTPNRSLHDEMQTSNSKNPTDNTKTTNRQRRLRPHERVMQTRTHLEQLFETKNFVKFFLVEASNEDEKSQ